MDLRSTLTLQKPASPSAFSEKCRTELRRQIHLCKLPLQSDPLWLAPYTETKAVCNDVRVQPGDGHLDHCGDQRHRLCFHQSVHFVQKRQFLQRLLWLAEQHVTLSPLGNGLGDDSNRNKVDLRLRKGLAVIP